LYSGIIVGVAVALFATMLVAIGALYARLRDIEKQMAVVTTQVSPLWARVQAQISSDLHHPHPRYFEMDKLLERLEALTITTAERVRLKELLGERAVDMHPDITESQRKAARAMIPVMDLVVLEAQGDDSNKEPAGIKP
jgi:hypothetical protein